MQWVEERINKPQSHEKVFCSIIIFPNLTNLSSGKFNVGVSATVKVTLKNGAFREDVGYGCVDGMRFLIALSL